MVKSSKILKEERASKIKAQGVLLETRKAQENGEFTEDQSTQFRTLNTEIESLDTQISAREMEEAAEKRAASLTGKTVDAPAIHKSTKNEQFSIVRSLHQLASGKQLTGVAAEVNERGVAEMKEQGMEVGEGLRIHLPSDMMQRGQTVTGDSGTKGGALVASTPQLVAPLTPNVDVLTSLGVNVMSGLVGDVPLPTSTLFDFAFVGETEDVAETDVDFAGPTLKPKRCAGVGGVSNKFLRQTSMNAEQYLINLMNNAYGAAIIKAFINGAGGDAPTGLYSLITSNIDTTATGPTRAIVTALEALVNDANGTNVARGYLSDSKLAGVMKNTAVDAGSGRFLYEGEALNGYKYEQSSLVDTLDVGASHPLIFGDWAQAALGTWGNMSVMVDPYTLASASKVRLIVEGFSDSALTNEKAFAINKVLTTS